MKELITVIYSSEIHITKGAECFVADAVLGVLAVSNTHDEEMKDC